MAGRYVWRPRVVPTPNSRIVKSTTSRRGAAPVDEQFSEGAPLILLEPWAGHWDVDDPNANFKADVALYSLVDPLVTLDGLSRATDLPVGVLARYVLARFATSGSSGMLELGPMMIERLWGPVAHAEETDDDQERLMAYGQLRELISWLRGPLFDPHLATTAYQSGSANTPEEA